MSKTQQSIDYQICVKQVGGVNMKDVGCGEGLVPPVLIKHRIKYSKISIHEKIKCLGYKVNIIWCQNIMAGQLLT